MLLHGCGRPRRLGPDREQKTRGHETESRLALHERDRGHDVRLDLARIRRSLPALAAAPPRQHPPPAVQAHRWLLLRYRVPCHARRRLACACDRARDRVLRAPRLLRW